MYVDDGWAGLPFGSDVDGNGPLEHFIGYDAFARITDGVSHVADSGTVIVMPLSPPDTSTPASPTPSLMMLMALMMVTAP